MRPEYAEKGMVVSVHVLASEAGVEMMKAGGNAVDAAVATGFALAVVHPAAGNIGGGGFMLVRLNDGSTNFIDYREKAPGKATETMYQDENGNVIPNLSRVGYKAVGVPGSVKGLVHAQKRYGKLTLEQVMAPAIRLAREGFELGYGEARSLTNFVGNGVAAIVVSRWEGELDTATLARELAAGPHRPVPEREEVPESRAISG